MSSWRRLFFLGVLIFSWNPFVLGGRPQASTKRVLVQFTFHPQKSVRSVAVVGDFNDWKPDATPMEGPDSKGVWRTRLRLPYGVYEYRFLVNGNQWLRDPENLLYGG